MVAPFSRHASAIASVLAVVLGSMALMHCGSSSGAAASADAGADMADAGALPSTTTGDAGGSAADAGLTIDPAKPMTCTSSADCTNGETCSAGVCGLPGCSVASPAAPAPLGQLYALAPVRQVVLANGSDSLALTFDGAPLALVGNGTFHPASAPTAITAGRFLTTSATAAGLAVARAGTNGFTILAAPADSEGTLVSLAFAPIALSARDFDGDGIDDVVALGAAGDVALCNVAKSKCTSSTLGGTGVDIAAGDALQDGVMRAVVFTLDANGKPALTVWSPTLAVATAQTGNISSTLTHVALGDVDGDGHDDIIGLEDGGYVGFASDKLHLYKFTTTMIDESTVVSVARDSVDLDVGTFDGTSGAQISLLRSGSVVDEYTGPSFAALAVTGTATLDDVQDATMMAVGDVRGLSAMGILEGAPTLVQGNPTPVFAAFYPPFSSTESSGFSDVILTSTTSATDMTSQSLSVRAAATVGYGAGLGTIASANISARIEGTLAATSMDIQTLTLAETFSLYANDALMADDAAVVVAGTCFRGYRYHVVDPSGRLGTNGDGTTMAVLMPVGAERSVWSLSRYNAVAKALGNLPLLPTTYLLGEPGTYPSKTATFAGDPIAAADLVFPQLDSYEVTSSARINLHLTLSDQSVNQLAATATATLTGSATLGGATASDELAVSYNTTDTITLGTQTDIALDVPQLRPGSTSTYAFTPYLYKEHYGATGATGASGSAGAGANTAGDSSLYVLSFSVGH